MRRTVTYIILLIFGICVSAQSVFNDIIRQAISNDRELRAKQASSEAEIPYNEIAGPEVEFEHLWPSREGEEVKWNLSVSQEFDYPGLYKARSKVADLERERSALVLMDIKVGKALAVKQLIIDIINSHRRYELYSAISRNISRIDSLTRISYEKGNSTSLDLWKMKFAVLENEQNIAKIEGDIRALEGALLATGVDFINGEDEFWHDYPLQQLINPSTADLSPLTAALIKNSSALGQAKIKAMKLEAVPSFSLGYVHAFEENTHFNGFSVSLRLPSYSQSRKNKVARLEAEAADWASSFDAANVEAELQGQYDEALILHQALESYREVTGNDEYLELLDKAYRGGALTVLEYLNELNLFISARIDYLDLEYRYNLALARLNRYRSLDF